MKKQLLLPRKCRLIGCILFPFGVAWMVAGYIGNHEVFPFLKYGKMDSGDILGPGFIFSKGFGTDFNGELSILVTLISLLMIAFSKEKVEDEYVRSTRLHALQVSVYVNYLILAVASFLFYSFSYIYVMQINCYSILIIFILVFNYNLHFKSRLSKSKTS